MIFSSQAPSIVYQDENLLVLFKPARLYVHPPERKHIAKLVGRRTCIHWLQDTIGIKAYPIHRLDYATEGLILFGLHEEAASLLNKSMREGQIKKFYDVVVRGWPEKENGEINIPLKYEITGEMAECLTLYKIAKKIELPFSVNSKFKTTRYALLDIELITGRWRQIRRHMNRISHPVIGDREHGDSHHNRFFRDQLGIDDLCLRAKKLELVHPYKKETMTFTAPLGVSWQKIEDLYNK